MRSATPMIARKSPSSGKMAATRAARPAAPRHSASSSLWALSDQAIVSGGNFLTTIIVGRFAGQAQLGVYRMGMSLVVVMLSLPASLVWTPFNARSSAMRSRKLANYSGSARQHVLWIAGAAAGVMAVAALLATSMFKPLFAALALTVVVMLLRENLRRMAFASMRIRQVIVVDIVATGVQVGGLYLFYLAGWLTGASAYLVVGLACLAALAVGRIGAPAGLGSTPRRALRDFRDNWRLARFVFLGAILYACTNGAYPWLLSFFAGEHGEQAVGGLAIAESAIFLANPLLIAAGNFLGPAAAHALRDGGMQGLRRSTIGYTAAIGGVMLTFTVVLGMWGDAFVQMIFDRETAGLTPTIVSLGLAQTVSAALIPVRAALFALEHGRCMVWGGALRLSCVATLGAWSVQRWGAVGVGIGMMTGDLLALGMKWIVFRRLAASPGGASCA